MQQKNIITEEWYNCSTKLVQAQSSILQCNKFSQTLNSFDHRVEGLSYGWLRVTE